MGREILFEEWKSLFRLLTGWKKDSSADWAAGLCVIWFLEPSFSARTPVQSLFMCPGHFNDFILQAARNCGFLREWVGFLLFTLPVFFCRPNLALSDLGSAGGVAWQTHEVRHKLTPFLHLYEGPGFCFLLCLWLTEMTRSRLSCLSQRLETWNFSRTVTLPYVENSSIDYFPGWRCMHKAGADTGIIHINPRQSGDQHKCV